MGSDKGNGRHQGPGRGRKGNGKRQRFPFVESLERRTLLDGGASKQTPPAWQATSTDLANVKNGPLAKGGQNLIQVYEDFLRFTQQGDNGNFAASPLNSEAKVIEFKGDNVGIDVSGFGDFGGFVRSLTNLGLQVIAANQAHELVDGWLPIAELPAVATSVQTVGMTPLYTPSLSFKGSANNQAEVTLRANLARTQFNVDGTGVNVGVMSDSAGQVGNGLMDSINSGDLPASASILQDGAAGSTDEGRAMMENIYDIAPGAKLQFNTVGVSENTFAQGIHNLANAGNQIIVDDVKFVTEPMFQDGIVAQAVTDVVNNQGVTYFSSAGNQKDGGYLSQWRPVSATVTGVGTGTFMDFDPGAGVQTLLPITVNTPGPIVFQYDNPFYTTNGVTADLDIFILDSNNNVVASGTTNNIASQTPLEFFNIGAAGNYSVAIRETTAPSSGPDVGHVEFRTFSDITVSKQFGNAGGTFYPTTFGHASANEAISTGAVPFWAAGPTPPFVTPSPVMNEGFSSFGPSLIVFNPDGTRRGAPQLRLKPDVSGVDGGNTSFFGFDIDTTNPPPGTGPATTTDLDLGPNGQPDSLPNFFGTSSAAPNLAAVAALMKQLDPAAKALDIKSAMIAGTTPLNGVSKDVWDPQGGFGLVDATQALNAIDKLRVVTTIPANGATLTTAPSAIVFVFSKPVNPATLSSNELTFTATPNSQITAQVVGQPVLINPTTVAFAVTISAPAGVKANGNFSYQLSGNLLAQDGKPLTPFTASFTLSDLIAPRVTNVTLNGRIITIQFSEAMRADTINRNSVFLARTGAAGVFGASTNVNLNSDPRMIVNYDPFNNRVILDASQLDQTELPSDHYAVVVRDTATDLVGNRLDGEFSGVFPSGNGVEGGTFVLDLPNQVLIAPFITSLKLAGVSERGIPGQENTSDTQPIFIGTVGAKFPGTLSGLTVVAQFNGLHGGTFDLNVGPGGRGFSGNVDASYAVAVTDAQGHFALRTPGNLPDGFNMVRLVVIGQPDAPPLPGLSSLFNHAFRIDTTNPIVLSTSVPNFARLNGLAKLSVNVADPVLPANLGNPLAVPTTVNFPALNPQTANNISNYSLINLGPDNALGTADDRDFSNFITSAHFVDTTIRANTNDPYTGRVDLTFAPGLPSGRYLFVVRTAASAASGISDAAGNPLDGNPAIPGNQNFALTFDLQPEPVFITQFAAVSPTPTPGGDPFSLYGPRSFFEVPEPGVTPRAPAPPTSIQIDFSNPLDPSKSYNDAIQLIRSADTPASPPDGDFGVNGTTGFTRVAGTSVTLSSIGTRPDGSPKQFGDPGYLSRLTLTLPAGTTLPPDHYRVYIPNKGTNAIFDLFGNQLDGEFLGNPNAQGSLPPSGLTATTAPEPPLQFEDLLPNGQFRAGLSGDGIAGGAFTAGFIVVPNGNVIYARPDYVDDPILTSDDPDGSIAKPYPALAPEAIPNAFNNGDLNSVVNFANFDQGFDRNGNGHFDRSAFFAAQVASQNGPVVIAALPGNITAAGQRTFVLQAPAGTDRVRNDGSASLPFDSTLVFAPNSALKLENASLFAQNQGTSIEVLGGPNPGSQVNFTSFLDDSVGGDTNGDGSDSKPSGGDWGGIVFRSFDQRNRTTQTSTFPVDGRLKGPGGTDARSGADDTLSAINFAVIKFAGSAVPQTIGPLRYDAIMSFNARPFVSNVVISQTGGANGAQAPISGDLDSFREDDITRGMLVRRATLFNNSINGLLVRAQPGGTIEATDAVARPDNPTTSGGAQNYVFDSPIPYVMVARMAIGQMQLQDTGGLEQPFKNRLYIEPGMLIKANAGAGIEVTTPGASLNVGDRTYIKGFDADPSYSPLSPNFKPPTVGDAKVLFTSFFDDNATTFFHDQVTGVDTTIVAPLDTDNGGPFRLPTPGNVDRQARWGGVTIHEGSIAVIDESTFQFGGGPLNLPTGTDPIRPVLTLRSSLSFSTFGNLTSLGSHVYITNNDFLDNFEAAIGADPNSLLAGDPLRPLASGHPFLRGNIMERNTYDGLRIYAVPGVDTISGPFPPGISDGPSLTADNFVTQTVNAVWDLTDVTYILRGSILLDNPGYSPFFFGGGGPPLPSATQLLPEKKPSITLTIQSALPDTLLANGQRIPKPGESVLVKLLSFATNQPAGDGVNGSASDSNAGAGFQVGVDDGVDPNTDPLIDQGLDGQIRIVGIPGNETTGQQRVPAIITSLFDSTVGKTVRGVNMTTVYHPTDPNFDPVAFDANGNVRTTPQPGDGGLIYFGGLSLTDYNLLDPRDGNLIDNADIRYMTRIEMQGGGVDQIYDFNDDKTYDFKDDPRKQKLGFIPGGTTADPLTQFNQVHAMTISNSNLFGFSQVGVLAHPGFNEIGWDIGPMFGHPAVLTPIPIQRLGFRGEPIDLFMVNDSVANMPTGVRMVSDGGPGPFVQGDVMADAYYLTLLHNTFNNDDNAVRIVSEVGNTTINSFSAVRWLAMDNIFSNSSVEAITSTGQPVGSQAQFNLFFGNKSNISITGTGVIWTPPGGFAGNNGVIVGDPKFRNAAAGDFNLMPGSAAVDAARSEIGPNQWANMLFPIADQVLGPAGGIRNGTGRFGALDDFPGFFGGLGPVPANQIITLPGSNQRPFVDEWVAVPQGTPGSFSGPASNPDSYNYMPITGERDQRGFLRIDDPSSPNVGSGAKPFFDVGAFELRKLTAPRVTDVQATITDPTSPTGVATLPIYKVGGIAGTNKSPQKIMITFDSRLDPNTITNKTVLLESSGGDGIFGNGNSSQDKFIDLSGKLSFDLTTHVLTIDLSNSNLSLNNDEYRIILQGNGGEVIRDPQGNALDGENTVNDDPNNPQLPLPSGDGIPGGNFFVTFTIDTNPPKVVQGTVTLDPSTDTAARDGITDTDHPSFSGLITDIFPPLNPGVGQTVILDVSTKGDGNFDRLNVGTATTTAVFDAKGNIIPNEGHFLVTVTGPGLSDSPYSLGPDGKLSLFSGEVKGFSVARIRVIDQSGNVSNPNDPAATTAFIVDTKGPRVTGTSPLPNTQVMPSNGQVTVQIALNENIDPASINPNTVKVIRSGGDGIFGNKNDVLITPSSVTLSPGQPFSGAETLTIVFGGSLPNDLYDVKLVGTGSNTVTDIAGNAIDGEIVGPFPSGDGKPGGDFDLNFVIFNPANSKLVFVGPNFITDPTQPQGTRANPFLTITDGINAAQIGDEVIVLPGVYTENVTLKSLVRVLSGNPSSTDVNFVPGDALKTIIRAPVNANARSITVQGTNLASIGQLDTELAGFTIASPLNGDPATGPILDQSIGVFLVNSNALIDKNYFIDNFFGIAAATSGANAPAPRIVSNGAIGNVHGILLTDMGNTTSLRSPFEVANNTITNNTIGVLVIDTGTEPGTADIVNNIFWQNNDLSSAHNGSAITVVVPGKTLVRTNLFGSGNGPAAGNPGNETSGVGAGFDPSLLGPTPDALGNFTGEPAFVSPRDPRPNADGPAIFLTDANFDLTGSSAAIDNALNAVAPTLDFRYRGRVDIPGVGFPGRGPADIGAFEFKGSGGISAGGSFRVVTTSLSGSGSTEAFGQSVSTSSLMGGVIVTFSDSVDRSSVSPSDLILSGDGLDSTNPAHAVGLSWIDDHTVDFLLSGRFLSSGTVNLNIAPSSILSSNEAPIAGFSDFVALGSSSSGGSTVNGSPNSGGGITTASVTTPAATPQPLSSATPAALVAVSNPVPQTPPPAPSPGTVHRHVAPLTHHRTSKPSLLHTLASAFRGRKGKRKA